MQAESFIQRRFADRIGGERFGKDTAIYKFEKIKRAKRAAQQAHPDVPLLDLGVGEPDDMAFPEVVQKLCEEAAKPENRGYADNGGPVLKEAAARYMQRVCGVKLDPETQILHSIGSKAALSILPAALINPGDVTLMTVPGYPVFGTHAKYYGGEVYNLPLLKQNAFLPDLKSIPPEILKRAKVLVLNYPNNPTGASATEAFFKEVVEWALQNEIIVIHDFAYAALVYEGKPLSFLSIPGAMEVGIELHSASKNFNMTGWRCGFVAGNPLLIKAYGAVKDNTDSGQFLAIQHAVAYCFDHPEITQAIAAKYSRRMDLLVPALKRLGFDVEKPKGSFFLYAPSPRAAIRCDGSKIEFPNAEAFSQWMITEHLISTVPWDDAGSYIRFSVTFSAPGGLEKEKEVIAELERRLSSYQLIF
ncbi:MAG: LL-diaminopimelate aminotransferase [Methylacidiphilales bacterium]|nr:LL-diaminopimelate aminotransferase [Candidatus Methylacidiphilales bacterium]MDW8348728.1 LL-diaminopimelate aminotransferase [Verrucomicrobiae bacterium]